MVNRGCGGGDGDASERASTAGRLDYGAGRDQAVDRGRAKRQHGNETDAEGGSPRLMLSVGKATIKSRRTREQRVQHFDGQSVADTNNEQLTDGRTDGRVNELAVDELSRSRGNLFTINSVTTVLIDYLPATKSIELCDLNAYKLIIDRMLYILYS